MLGATGVQLSNYHLHFAAFNVLDESPEFRDGCDEHFLTMAIHDNFFFDTPIFYDGTRVFGHHLNVRDKGKTFLLVISCSRYASFAYQMVESDTSKSHKFVPERSAWYVPDG